MLNLLIVFGVIVAASLAAAAISILALRCLFWLMAVIEPRLPTNSLRPGHESLHVHLTAL